MHRRKIVKYTLRTLLGLVAALVLIPASLYIPAVQDFVRVRAERSVARSLGMELSIGRIRLAFPLRLSADDVLLRQRGDTLVRCGRLSLDVALLPLLRSRAVIRNFELGDFAARYRDSVAGTDMRLAAGRLGVYLARVDLKAGTADVFRVALADGDAAIGLEVRETAEERPDSAAALPWKIAVGRISVANTAFRMRTSPDPSELSVRLAEGEVNDCRVGLDSARVEVAGVRLTRGVYSYVAAPSREVAPEEGSASERSAEFAAKSGPGHAAEDAAEGAAGAPQPWTVRVGRVELADNRAAYGTMGHAPAAGFDPEAVTLSALNLTLDSVYNRGGDIALRIERLDFAERSGLAVRSASGRFVKDGGAVSLEGFRLATASSRIDADVQAGPGALGLAPAAEIGAALRADLSTRDMRLLFPVPEALGDREVSLSLTAAGTLADLRRIGLELSVPGHGGLRAEGRAKNLPEGRAAAVSVRFEGDFRELEFLEALLPDTALRRRVAIPARMTLRGAAELDRGAVAADAALEVGGGSLSAAGRLDPAAETYEARVRCDGFPLGAFLPADSLGTVDFAAEARGAGFDPFAPQTTVSVSAGAERLEYAGRDFGGIGIDAVLESGRLSGRIADRDEALRLVLDLSGEVTRERQSVRLAGRVAEFDLTALGVTPDRIGGTFGLDFRASASQEGTYAASLALDSIGIRNGYRTDRIRPTSVAVGADTASVRAEVRSGDFVLTLSAPASPDSLLAAAARASETLRRQLREQAFDMEELQDVLPRFRLQAEAGRSNILNNFLRTKGASFRGLHVAGANDGAEPLSLRMRVDGLDAGGVVLDTVALGIAREERRLAYRLGVSNAPGHLDHVAQAALYGHVVRNTGQVNFRQRDRAGREGFRFGFDVEWTDSLVRAGMTPLRPLFGSEPWEVNAGNYVEYGWYDRRIAADLDMRCGGGRFALRSVPADDGEAESLRLDVAGVGIGAALGMLPAPPPVDGVLGAGVVLEMRSDSLAIRGDVSVTELSYGKQRFGDVALGVRYGQGRGRRADARVTLDGSEVFAAHGDLRPDRDEPLDLTLTVPGFPLQRLDVFLPADLLRLSGEVQAAIHVGGAPERPKLDGGVRFAATDVRVPMIGTSFRLASDTIRLRDGRMLFDDYALTGPNRKPLTVAGTVDLSDFGRVAADLALRASDFQFVDVARRERTAVYGKAFLDLDVTARGPVDALVVRGRAALLGGTDISYVMQDSPMEVRERPQNVVTFVSFRELDEEPAEQAPPREMSVGGMDVHLDVDINDDVRAGVDLSADGSNRIDLQGGGSLTYTMNPLGDTRLAGRYVLSGGMVRYNPPVISQKTFKIRPGGYVEWMGNIADPTFSLTAVETVRASVSSDGQNNRPVNFDISIRIRNTLADLSVSFDLAAPEDLAMQNELNSLTAEQRASQAMNLLIYNTYSGPGSSATVASENPLNSFIQKELNQWAQNSLKGVDLSFGIDSYGEDDPNGQRTDYSYRLSKSLFSDRVRAVIGGRFSTGNDPSENLRENLIDDISLEYMLTRRDNMFIRLFRHTGYESILEGEITETGVGFVIRKKLLRLTDLFRPANRKEKKKEEEKRDETAVHE